MARWRDSDFALLGFAPTRPPRFLSASDYLKHVNIGVDTVSVPSISWEIRARVVRKLVHKKAKKTAPLKAAA